MPTLNVIGYKGDLYVRATPVKSLFNSSLVHSVVTRGDVFAVSLSTGLLTVIPGTADVEHTTISYQTQAKLI